MSLSVLSPITLLSAALISVVPTYGHGRLQVPMTRKNVLTGYDAYENDPVNFGTTNDATTYKKFSCRNDPPKKANGDLEDPPTTVWAGEEMDVMWLTSADHVGDCAMYVSYDYDFEGDNIKNMEWFKIANWKDCKSIEEQDNEITVPDWLPAGRAVFRWDWYALHVHPSIEFYAQCADVEVMGSGNSLEVSQVPKYSMMGLYPEKDGAEGWTQGWRYGYGDETWMTGPPCACKSDPLNNCEYTKSADVTEGYIAKNTLSSDSCTGSTNAAPSPNPTPQPTPQPTPSPVVAPTAAPVVAPTLPPSSPVVSPTPPPSSPVTSPTQAPDDDCQSLWGKCGGNNWTGPTCCEGDAFCNYQTEWYSQCIPTSQG